MGVMVTLLLSLGFHLMGYFIKPTNQCSLLHNMCIMLAL